jgi:hypothetical protein
VLGKRGDEAAALLEAALACGSAVRADPYVSLAFGGRDPLQPGFRPFEGAVHEPPVFRDLALAVCGPLVEHRTTEESA